MSCRDGLLYVGVVCVHVEIVYNLEVFFHTNA